MLHVAMDVLWLFPTPRSLSEPRHATRRLRDGPWLPFGLPRLRSTLSRLDLDFDLD